MEFGYLNYAYYYVRFCETTHTLEVGHETYGTILPQLRFQFRTANAEHRIEDYKTVSCRQKLHLDGTELSICCADGPATLPDLTVRIFIAAESVSVSATSEHATEMQCTLCGTVLWGQNPETETFAICSEDLGGDLFCAIGPATTQNCDSLFDRQTDRLLRMEGHPILHYGYEENAYTFKAVLKKENPTLSLTVREHYLAEQFALHYKPMNNQTTFKRPPVGWMTWYAVKFDASEESVLANSKIQKEKLAAYGADSVWVDWEWCHGEFNITREVDYDIFHPNPKTYPNGMKYVADEIRKDGFVPCIWTAPSHDVRINRFMKENPDVILSDVETWCGRYWYDPTHPKYLNEFIPAVFRKLTEEWGYKAIKWDTFPLSLIQYNRCHEKFRDPSVTPEQAIRNILQKAREVIGESVYITSCHGPWANMIIMHTDFFDAIRVGEDVFSWDSFLRSGLNNLYRFYPLHNTVMYCDPDNLILREEFNTSDQAVSRTSLLALLGTPVILGDDLRELPDDRVEMIRRAIPLMNTHPMYLQSKACKNDVVRIATAIRTRYDDYTVTDIFNTTDNPETYTLRFEDLGLPADREYLIYDFWNHTFLGKHRDTITLELRPYQSRVLSVRQVLNRPQLVATNRHITQGAFDIEEMHWDEAAKILSGTSKTVIGETYTVTVYDPQNDTVLTHAIDPNEERTEWHIQF